MHPICGLLALPYLPAACIQLAVGRPRPPQPLPQFVCVASFHTHCSPPLALVAGHLLDTTLTWFFPDVQENKAALFATPLVTASGDGTVSVQSLKQCQK